MCEKRCSAWGLFDMHGTAAELCWGETSSPDLFDPAPTNDHHVIMGGRINREPSDCKGDSELDSPTADIAGGIRVAFGQSFGVQ